MRCLIDDSDLCPGLQAAFRGVRWLIASKDQFMKAARSSATPTDRKALVELALLCYAARVLCTQSYWGALSPLYKIVREVSESKEYWRSAYGGGHGFPSSLWVILCRQQWEQIGKNEENAQACRDLLTVYEGGLATATRFEVLEVAFLADRLIPEGTQHKLLDATPKQWLSLTLAPFPEIAYGGVYRTYAFTHEAFFLTGFKDRPILPQCRDCLSFYVERYLGISLVNGNVDLLAELLIAGHCLGVLHDSEVTRLSCQMLLDAQAERGYFRPRARAKGDMDCLETSELFAKVYHPTIVADIACGLRLAETFV